MNRDSGSRATSLRERRQQRTRRELVDAVLAVVATGGLAETTIDRISAESGISRGTVYAHFPGGRDELLRAAYARLGEQLVDRTREAVLAADDWRGRIVAHARAMFDLAGDARIGHFYNVSGPTLIVDGAERGIGSGASILSIREALQRAQVSGDVDAGVDADAAAVLLVGALREAAIGVAAQTVDPRRAAASFERLVDGLAAR
ncbi:TetR/AcrR family transcriptional regulator [Leucobacter triazinivorans]|uniref:TetR/AcrR family transcriptional regulator n=1 Tax=Leucobacter triazinivorans TaxID=1784719 RepID=A0A4P6KI53_9MICO|nr:TetR/AcrR family transcriptional regulator [Leucobacter triazinivorans]QBE49761.1 TetR/AcrR family transcriptional regulator [Leucobacter triazinivorans]